MINKGFGSMIGFNGKKRSSIGGDFDGDGVSNRRDCKPMNFRRQGPEHRKFKCAAWEVCGSYVENEGDFCAECEDDAMGFGLI